MSKTILKDFTRTMVAQVAFFAVLIVLMPEGQAATKISELPTGQKVGNILDETLRVGGGATTSTTPTLTVPRDDSSTNTVPTLLRLQRTSSGTPATGIGAGLDFYIETSAGNNEIGYKLAAVATDVTSTSEDFDLVAYGQQAGSGTLNETLRVTGRGTLTATFIGGEKVSIGDSVSVYNVAGELIGYLTGTMRLASGGQYVFTSNANDAFNGVDTGIGRHAGGVTKGTNGSTTIRWLQGGGSAISSAAALPVPTGNVQHVTGTTGVTSISTTNLGSGLCTTLIFDDALTVTDGSNLKLAGDFTTTADDTLSVCFDGTNWYETARSIN